MILLLPYTWIAIKFDTGHAFRQMIMWNWRQVNDSAVIHMHTWLNHRKYVELKIIIVNLSGDSDTHAQVTCTDDRTHAADVHVISAGRKVPKQFLSLYWCRWQTVAQRVLDCLMSRNNKSLVKLTYLFRCIVLCAWSSDEIFPLICVACPLHRANLSLAWQFRDCCVSLKQLLCYLLQHFTIFSNFKKSLGGLQNKMKHYNKLTKWIILWHIGNIYFLNWRFHDLPLRKGILSWGLLKNGYKIYAAPINLSRTKTI